MMPVLLPASSSQSLLPLLPTAVPSASTATVATIVFNLLIFVEIISATRRYEIKSPKEFFDKHEVLTTAIDDDAFFEVPAGPGSVRSRQQKNNQQQANNWPVAGGGLRSGGGGGIQQRRGYPMVSPGEIDYGPNVSRVITHIINNKGYDKRIRPNYKGRPVNVGLTLFISGVSSVSEVNMDVTLDFYFRQFWQDPRLGFDGMWEEELVIGGEFMREIWRPDTFFVNVSNPF